MMKPFTIKRQHCCINDEHTALEQVVNTPLTDRVSNNTYYIHKHATVHSNRSDNIEL